MSPDVDPAPSTLPTGWTHTGSRFEAFSLSISGVSSAHRRPQPTTANRQHIQAKVTYDSSTRPDSSPSGRLWTMRHQLVSHRRRPASTLTGTGFPGNYTLTRSFRGGGSMSSRRTKAPR